MTSEKQVQLVAEPTVELPISKSRSRRRSLMTTLGGIALLTTGFATGMGVSMYCNSEHFQHQGSQQWTSSPGTSMHSHRRGSSAVSSPTSPASPTSPIEESFSASLTPRAAVWQPEPGLSWNYQLSVIPTAAQIANAGRYDVWNIDLYDTPASTIKAIQDTGSKVICYFSGGTYEEWRPDADKFKKADKGNDMADWDGETWIKTSSSNVRKIMAARLDLAKEKGCDAVDPDNIDGYNHDTGFNLKKADAVNYVNFLSAEAAKRGLAMGLKNSGEIIADVVDNVQFSVNEQCYEYNECEVYKPFIDEGKAVFHVEYPKGSDVNNNKKVSAEVKNNICGCLAYNFSPIIKNNNLNTWIQTC